jgi:hypothetical protein
MKCKDCKHSQRWRCGSKIIWYCGIRKSNRTQNKLLKIKANQEQCYLFEKEEENERNKI